MDGSVVAYTTPASGTLEVRAELRSRVVSSPEPPRFRICLQVFGYWLAPIAESCLGENDLTLDGVFTLTGSALISEQQPILIVAVLENIGDLSAAEADVQMITITLS